MGVLDEIKFQFANTTILNIYLIFNLRNIISTFEKEREQTKKTIEQAKKYAEGLVRERDLVRKELVKCNSEYKISVIF